MAGKRSTESEKVEARTALKKYLDTLGVNIESYAKERKMLAEKAEQVVNEEGTMVRLSYDVPLSEIATSKRAVELSVQPLTDKIGPIGPVVGPGLTACDPVGFFRCLMNALSSQLEKVGICMNGPSHPGDIWSMGEIAPLTITVTNHSEVTWKNVRAELQIVGPVSIMQTWFGPWSDGIAFWPVLIPGASRTFYVLLRAGTFPGIEDVVLRVLLCGEAALTSRRWTNPVTHKVYGQ